MHTAVQRAAGARLGRGAEALALLLRSSAPPPQPLLHASGAPPVLKASWCGAHAAAGMAGSRTCATVAAAAAARRWTFGTAVAAAAASTAPPLWRAPACTRTRTTAAIGARASVTPPHAAATALAAAAAATRHASGAPMVAGTRSLSDLAYHEAVNAALSECEEMMQPLELDGPEDFEMDLQAGVLTITVRRGTVFVINRQVPNKQLWWSSPVSGPKRFEYDEARRCWLDVATASVRLQDLLAKEICQLTGRDLGDRHPL